MVFEDTRFLPWRGLSNLHRPLAFFFVPVCTNHLTVEVHVSAEIECVAYFVEIVPDVRTVAEESRPVCVLIAIVRQRENWS